MSNRDIKKYNHEFIENDPIRLKNFTDCCIKVKLRDCSTHQGILCTVDPVSKSVVLVQRENEEIHLKVIVGKFIHEVRIITRTESTSPLLFVAPHYRLTESELAYRKVQIKKLLSDNCFTVIENDGVLEIGGVLFIEPPYQIDNCICTSSIVLVRVQNIMSQVTVN